MTAIIAAMAFTGCNNNDVENIISQEPTAVFTNTDGINVFLSAIVLNDLIETNSTASLNNRYKNTSLRFAAPVNEEMQLELEEKLADLIPDERFRNVVNEEGKLIVGNTIYQINEYGTLYTDLEFAHELATIDSIKVANAQRIAEKEKKIGNVFIYETYASCEAEDSDSEIEIFDIAESPSRAPAATNASEPNINAFPVKSSARSTVVGKWRDAIFGEDKWHYESMQSPRRIAAKLYDYNYIVTKSTGIHAKIQHNGTWLKTWGIVNSWSKPITIGWDEMLYKIKIPDMPKEISELHPIGYSTFESPNYTEVGTSVKFTSFPFAVGDGQASLVVPFFGKQSMSYAKIQEMIYKFSMKSLISSMNSASKTANGFMIDVPSEKARYIYIAKSRKSKVGREVEQNFGSSFGFEIFVGNGGFMKYFSKSVSASYNMKDFELVSGQAYAYTEDTNGKFVGMVIKKVK